jgi:methyl-accepting chemotaxis protein
MPEEVEIAPIRDEYEVVPLTPLRRLEEKIRKLESASIVPQLQMLITQIIELIKTNQKLIDEIVKADNELRNELSKLPKKIDELISSMREFIELVKAAGEEEVSFESAKTVGEQFKKIIEQNQQLLETNQQMLETLTEISKKLKGGTPVSQLLARYPQLKIRSLG